MNDDIVTRLQNQRTNSVLCNEAANWIDLYRAQIVHLWAHHRNCGDQNCALCAEAYATYKKFLWIATLDE